MKPLSEVDSFLAEKVPRLLVFDTLGNGLKVEGFGHADNGAYESLIGLACEQFMYEVEVDL